MQFTLIEPMNTLFKDEVRALGTELGIPDEIVWRRRSRDRVLESVS